MAQGNSNIVGTVALVGAGVAGLYIVGKISGASTNQNLTASQLGQTVGKGLGTAAGSAVKQTGLFSVNATFSAITSYIKAAGFTGILVTAGTIAILSGRKTIVAYLVKNASGWAYQGSQTVLNAIKAVIKRKGPPGPPSSGGTATTTAPTTTTATATTPTVTVPTTAPAPAPTATGASSENPSYHYGLPMIVVNGQLQPMPVKAPTTAQIEAVYASFTRAKSMLVSSRPSMLASDLQTITYAITHHYVTQANAALALGSTAIGNLRRLATVTKSLSPLAAMLVSGAAAAGLALAAA